MSFDVFISYPHQDKAVADAACAKLEAEGIRCWIAPRDIAPSAEWAASIVDAIDRCLVMVLIFSSHANQSKQVHREIQQAFDGEKPVVPFRIEDVGPEKSLRYYMSTVHWLDALTPPLEDHLQGLAISIRALVAATTTEKDRTLGEAEVKAVGLAREVDERSRAGRDKHRRVAASLAHPLWPPSRPALLIGSLIGLVVLGVIGAWLARPPMSVAVTSLPPAPPTGIASTVLSPEEAAASCASEARQVQTVRNKFNTGYASRLEVGEAELSYLQAKLTCQEISKSDYCSEAVKLAEVVVTLEQQQMQAGAMDSSKLISLQNELAKTTSFCK